MVQWPSFYIRPRAEPIGKNPGIMSASECFETNKYIPPYHSACKCLRNENIENFNEN